MDGPVDRVLARIAGVRRSGRGWLGHCPGHEDHHASLSIAAGDDGRALLICHAGCKTEAVVGALGLGMADLYPSANGAGPASRGRGRGQEVRYPARLADGSLSNERFEHVRLDRPDGSKRMWWERDGRKGLNGLSPSGFALYEIEYVDATASDDVVVVEGEKAADALRSIGVPAVGSVTGAAATPCHEALVALAGRKVVLWPDADAAGLAHVQRIATALVGVAASVSWVKPPAGAEPGWDAADATPEQARMLIAAADLQPADLVDGDPGPEATIVPPPSAPMAVARKLVADRFTDASGMVVIRAWRGGYCAWDGQCWPDRDVATIRAETYRYLEHAAYEVETSQGTVLRPWDPTRAKVANALEALAAVTHLPPTIQPPTWLDGEGLPDARDLVVTANGILHLPDRRLLPHDPRLFMRHSVPFGYDAGARTPARWLAFLTDLWEGDTDSIALLQEMFGYALSGDTSLQKIMLLVGPTRAGKGVISNVLSHLMGRHNVGAPTLAGLTTNFGLQDLIGKTLAIVSDARLGPKANVQALAERLLSVSGEDSITIDRKYRDPWTGPLGVRFMLLTNELPRFRDASGALAKRFVVLVLSKTFYGKENPGLLAELLPELPGIMNWALDGLDRLRAQRRFTEPATAREAMRELEDLASPMSAFLRDRCTVGRDEQVAIDDLWAAWKVWCEDQSAHHGTKQTFGRDLRAAVPGLRRARPRDGRRRDYVYEGVGLASEENSVADHGPRGPAGPDEAHGPHGPWTGPLFSQPTAESDVGPDHQLPANDDGWVQDGRA